MSKLLRTKEELAEMNRIRGRRFREKNREKVREKTRKYKASPKGIETRNKNWIKNRETVNAKRKTWPCSSKERQAAASAKHYAKNLFKPSFRMKHLLQAAKTRAKAKQIPFEIELFDVFVNNPPTNCACCDIVLDYTILNGKNRRLAPSFDRVDNTSGYVVGNVALICRFCNTLKRDASIGDFKKLIKYIEKYCTNADDAPLLFNEHLKSNGGR